MVRAGGRIKMVWLGLVDMVTFHNFFSFCDKYITISPVQICSSKMLDVILPMVTVGRVNEDNDLTST